MNLCRTTTTGWLLWRSGGLLTRALLVATCAAAGAVADGFPAAAETAAVVIMYHRFGEPKYPSTNITLKQFEAHIQELQTGGYRVVGLPEIIAARRKGKPLPDRAVGLSIDDAFRSVYREAWPRLKEAGFPFTLFVATGPIDRKASDFMSWDQIREMAAAGVTIGSQTVSHLHMADASPERNREELDRSNRRFEEELGHSPDLFAYPYGESSLAVQALVKEMNFTAAFGQHSGAIDGDDHFDLPRFSMNEDYGGQARFRLAINALPLPVTDVTPADPLITANNPPAMGFTIAGNIQELDRLACFLSHEGRARLEHLGGNRIEIRVKRAFPKGRTRVNCTLPVSKGRFRWFGRQFYKGSS